MTFAEFTRRRECLRTCHRQCFIKFVMFLLMQQLTTLINFFKSLGTFPIGNTEAPYIGYCFVYLLKLTCLLSIKFTFWWPPDLFLTVTIRFSLSPNICVMQQVKFAQNILICTLKPKFRVMYSTL